MKRWDCDGKCEILVEKREEAVILFKRTWCRSRIEWLRREEYGCYGKNAEPTMDYTDPVSSVCTFEISISLSSMIPQYNSP